MIYFREEIAVPFQFDSRVRYSEMGLDKRLTLVSLVDYFQDCSTFQSEDYGVGIDVLKEKSRAWMVLSWQIEILRRPVLGEKIVALWFSRDYEKRPYAFMRFAVVGIAFFLLLLRLSAFGHFPVVALCICWRCV